MRALRLLDGVRSIEQSNKHCPCIEEPFNTISNAAFGVLGLIGYMESQDEIATLYAWMLAACFCSGIHHASPRWMRRGTLVLDWVPIAVSLVLNWQYDTLKYLTPSTIFKATVSFAFLFNDLVDVIPVPWGHVTWHFLAAFTVDSHYREMAVHSE
jgi:hypothetical protein